MKANRKRLKANLASGVRKLGPVSVAPELGEFPLFDKFFPDLNNFWDLADFWDLDIFWPFDFLDFLEISTPPPSTASSPSPSPSSYKINLSGGAAVFNIKVSGAAILLKPWMNC